MQQNRAVQRLVGDLNRTYVHTSALWSRDQLPEGFSWIDATDSSNNVLSFARTGSDGSCLVCVANFAAVPHHDYRLGLPTAGAWREVINTDAQSYAGSGVGNAGTFEASASEWNGRPASATVQLPPLATVWLRPSQ